MAKYLLNTDAVDFVDELISSRVHRSALIACVYRAAEWHHKDVELAAHELLQKLDRATA